METMDKREFYFYPQANIVRTFDKMILERKDIMFGFGNQKTDRVTFSDILHNKPLGVMSETGEYSCKFADLGLFMNFYSMGFSDKGAARFKVERKEDGTEYPLLQGENVFQYAKLKYPELHGSKVQNFAKYIPYTAATFFNPFAYSTHQWELIRKYLGEITGIVLGSDITHNESECIPYWRYKQKSELIDSDGKTSLSEYEGEGTTTHNENVLNYICRELNGRCLKKRSKFQCFFESKSKFRYKCLVALRSGIMPENGFEGCGLIEFENAWNILYESDWMTGKFESPWFENMTEPTAKEYNIFYGWESISVQLVIIPETYDAYHPVTLEPINLVEPEENKT